MRVTASSPAKVQFITERLRQGLGRKEILAEYRVKWHETERNFDYHLRSAKQALSKERTELDKHRLEVMKAEQTQAIRTSLEYVLNLQNLVDELNEQFERAKTSKERIDTALAIVKVVAEINRMQGYYASAKSEMSLQIEPQEDVIGKYFEMVDARLREEREREINDMLD